ncbi:MAG TPA: ATP-binding protein [Gaiellaceae bacterium]|nr:ATP-binding protein [Gaiellaceae bacterium]
MLDVPTHGVDGSRPRLRLRFALYTGVVLLGVGLAVTWLVNREVAQRAARTVQAQARAVALTNLRRQLRPSDFAGPVSPERRAALDALFRTSIIVPGVVGGRLFARDGTITYSTRHVRIGHLTHHPAVLRAVLSGRMTQRVTAVTTWRGQKNVKVLQILAPVRPTPSSRPIGVVRVDQDYRTATVSAGDAQARLALILAVALIVLFVSLLPIMNRLTRQLEARNRRLREVVEAERAARAEAEAVQRLLSEQNERLRELDRLKDEFVSLVSHELRTPLTSIRGYIELLLEDGDQADPDQRRYLEIVDRNSERLLELVSDLLLLAQIEAGKLGIERRQVDLSKIVEECIETSSPAADARGIELVAKVERVPKLQGDRARLAQVLDNLVSNGLKFTQSGGRVEVRLETEDGAAVLEVEDTGLGIPASEHERLFERFFRSSNATENAIPGTGLGLTITKAIVERHGGRIEIESAEGAGTIVRVRLPLLARVEAEARSLAAA